MPEILMDHSFLSRVFVGIPCKGWRPFLGVKKRAKIISIILFIWFDMGVSTKRGTPKWMVYNGKPYSIKMDDLGGTTIFGNPHIWYDVSSKLYGMSDCRPRETKLHKINAAVVVRHQRPFQFANAMLQLYTGHKQHFWNEVQRRTDHSDNHVLRWEPATIGSEFHKIPKKPSARAQHESQYPRGNHQGR